MQVACLPWILAGVLSLWPLAMPLAARTMYATDTCEIVVRSAKQIVGRNIIKVLSSGAPLEVRDSDDVWAAVRLEDGRTGYVERKHLVDREPYKMTAERLQVETGAQHERLAGLTQQLTTLREEHQRLQKTHGQTEAQLQNVTQKYTQLRQEATTAQYLDTQEKYTALIQSHTEMQQQFATLNATHIALQNSTRLLWFLSGAVVILIGWFLGMLSARWRGRKRQSGYSYQLPG
ncbi:MAG: TIGR04211 family SH3 domain-containing protein [Candidatus Tectomicrobia bacterium]|uniref:TIGR04211 family SH3 domain-containing protein n=1 Tax=Tectimicrobiota bacterium TaxID=2528274 RepID=A0A937W3C4_UNCTE|nr:TIGR04211 family SH3 domain-containing protein [Candidatus Tectomicrobia bacterium]